MFKLIKNATVYNPKLIGKQDILICNNKIVKIAEHIDFSDALTLDFEGYIAIPGIIDQHIHVTGGGGEGGFHTRTPEVKLSDLLIGGVTTVVGLLGTDSLTRSVENLVAKTKALKNEGVSAFCLTGGYHYPSPTITGHVDKDIAFIEEVIGVKLAISDHRESHITKAELKKLASEVRVSSMVASKAGIIALHLGDDFPRLNMIFDIIDETSIPINHFRPTHVNRNQELFAQALLYLEKGGTIDLTVGSSLDKLIVDIQKIKAMEQAIDRVTFSSDGNGSWSKNDEFGKLLELGVSRSDGVLNSMKFLIENGEKIEDVIKFGTSNVANALMLNKQKGYLNTNYDADILILDNDFNLNSVISQGKIMMLNKEIVVNGTFEI